VDLWLKVGWSTEQGYSIYIMEHKIWKKITRKGVLTLGTRWSVLVTLVTLRAPSSLHSSNLSSVPKNRYNLQCIEDKPKYRWIKSYLLMVSAAFDNSVAHDRALFSTVHVCVYTSRKIYRILYSDQPKFYITRMTSLSQKT
jgi:hypothetical protein